MAQLIVRNLEDDLKWRLKRQAARNHRSMEEEVREILRDTLKAEAPIESGLGSEIASLFSGIGLDRDIPELRGHRVKPAAFD